MGSEKKELLLRLVKEGIEKATPQAEAGKQVVIEHHYHGERQTIIHVHLPDVGDLKDLVHLVAT